MKESVAKIEHVSDYLELVSEYVSAFPNDIIVYRGEDKLHNKPCIPNIFRKEALYKSSGYEKNLLDSMRQNKLSSSESYLENAIDAQHGEFPSRLLDVSYNCLVALYFAVTPYYHYSEDANDNEAGQVFVFHFDKVSSPSAKSTKNCYDTIINKKQKVLAENLLFRKKHMFIDHCKINNRIIAQQGAFILFQGDDAEPLPAYLFKGIEIPANSKKNLRKELNLLFGIHTGTIYPEIVNLASELSKKSKKVSCIDHTIEWELKELQEQFELELEYYFRENLNATHENEVEIARITEKVIYSYQLGIIQLNEFLLEEKRVGHGETDSFEKALRSFINFYNACLDEFISGMSDSNIDILNVEKLKINLEE